MSVGHSLQLMWIGVGAIVFLLIVASLVGRWLPKRAQINQPSKKSHLQWAWIGVAAFILPILLASLVEWRSAHSKPSGSRLIIDKNATARESTQGDARITQENPIVFNPEFETERQQFAPSSAALQDSPRVTLATHLEATASEKKSVDFLNRPDVIEAEQKLLEFGKMQSESDYKTVQELIRQTRIPGNLATVGWVAIDRRTALLSAETMGAYQDWRRAVLDAIPPKYSLQDVESATSGPAEFRTEQALNAKTHLLNVAAQMGPADSKLVATAIKSVERDGNGWTISDHLMDKVQIDTSDAYHRWKHAVWAARKQQGR